MKLYIYFHGDFDGMVSAALITAIFKKLDKYQEFIYKPVDFNIKDEWLDRKLEQPAAILDFFYHPDTTYYYDHHESSITEQFFGREAVDGENICLNIKFKSTPSILKYKFEGIFDFTNYHDLLEWSDIIDSCEYGSPRELYDSNEKYILLNKLISYYQDRNDEEEIIKIIPFMLDSLDEYLTQKNELLEKIMYEEKMVIEDLKEVMQIKHTISFVDQSHTNFAVQRFVSYYYYSDLDYQIIIYRKSSDYMVNFGRNPWKKFQSRNLGQIAMKHGGFGRQDVGGILVKTHQEAKLLVDVLLKDLSL